MSHSIYRLVSERLWKLQFGLSSLVFISFRVFCFVLFCFSCFFSWSGTHGLETISGLCNKMCVDEGEDLWRVMPCVVKFRTDLKEKSTQLMNLLSLIYLAPLGLFCCSSGWFGCDVSAARRNDVRVCVSEYHKKNDTWYVAVWGWNCPLKSHRPHWICISATCFSDDLFIKENVALLIRVDNTVCRHWWMEKWRIWQRASTAGLWYDGGAIKSAALRVIFVFV